MYLKFVTLWLLIMVSSPTIAIENGIGLSWSHDYSDMVRNNCTGTLVAKKFILTAAHCSHYNKPVIFHNNEIRNVTYKDHPEYLTSIDDNFDVSIWVLSSPFESSAIHYISDLGYNNVSNEELLTVYGFGGNELLNKATLKVNSNHLKNTNEIYGEFIGKGNTVKGDSGGAWVNNKNKIVGISTAGDGTIHKNSIGANLHYSKDFLLDTVNGWHYQGLARTTNSKVTVTVQSLHKNATSDTAYTSGDTQIVGGTCQGKSVINAFETCTYDIESQGSEGKLFLTSDEFVTINKANPPVKPDNGNGGGNSSSSGGSLGLFGLWVLACMAIRKKR